MTDDPQRVAETPNRVNPNPARESVVESAYTSEVERLNAQVNAARSWFDQLADPKNYPSDPERAVEWVQAFARQVRSILWERRFTGDDWRHLTCPRCHSKNTECLPNPHTHRCLDCGYDGSKSDMVLHHDGSISERKHNA